MTQYYIAYSQSIFQSLIRSVLGYFILKSSKNSSTRLKSITANAITHHNSLKSVFLGISLSKNNVSMHLNFCPCL